MPIKKVYIASPLFNPGEQNENEEIDKVLREAGYETFLPQRDGFLYRDLVKQLRRQGSTRKQAEQIALNLIVHLDVYQVCEGCDATVLNLNGRVPDEGAVSEGALCFRSEHPLVIYKQDARSLIDGKDNPLVVGLTGFEVVRRKEDIPSALRRLDTLEESAYARTIRISRELFSGYGSRNPDMRKLANLGREYFL